MTLGIELLYMRQVLGSMSQSPQEMMDFHCTIEVVDSRWIVAFELAVHHHLLLIHLRCPSTVDHLFVSLKHQHHHDQQMDKIPIEMIHKASCNWHTHPKNLVSYVEL